MNNAGENPSVGAVCECPLGFTGESCQHTTDIKVNKSLYLNIHFFLLLRFQNLIALPSFPWTWRGRTDMV